MPVMREGGGSGGGTEALSVQIDSLRSELGEIRTDIRRIDDRLRAVDQRLATLERLHLPTPPANGGAGNLKENDA